MTILDSRGLDPEHRRLMNQLDHWLRLTLVRKQVVALFSISILAEIHGRTLEKGKAASLCRSILLNKKCRRVIAQVIRSTHPEWRRERIEKELLEQAVDLKEMARASRAGLVLSAPVDSKLTSTQSK